MTPLALSRIDTHFLPVLVADYLAVHLFVYGVLSLGLLFWSGVRVGRVAWLSGFALAAYGIVVFGGALDRYVASFMPNLSQGCRSLPPSRSEPCPTCSADSLATDNGRASYPQGFHCARRFPRVAGRGRSA